MKEEARTSFSTNLLIAFGGIEIELVSKMFGEQDDVL